MSRHFKDKNEAINQFVVIQPAHFGLVQLLYEAYAEGYKLSFLQKLGSHCKKLTFWQKFRVLPPPPKEKKIILPSKLKIPSEMEVAPPHKWFPQFSALIKL